MHPAAKNIFGFRELKQNSWQSDIPVYIAGGHFEEIVKDLFSFFSLLLLHNRLN